MTESSVSISFYVIGVIDAQARLVQIHQPYVTNVNRDRGEKACEYVFAVDQQFLCM